MFNSKKITRLAAIGGLALSILVVPAYGAPTQRPIQLGIRAEPVERNPAIYPPRALTGGIEGYALASFVINEDGTVGEVKILESVPKGYFESASRRAIRTWQFKPAVQDGRPVVQSKTKVIMTFVIDGRPQGASRGFVRNYKRALKALADNDLELAKSHFGKIDEKKLKGLYELLYFESMTGQIYAAEGENRKAITHLRRAMRGGGTAIEEKSYMAILKLLYILQIAEYELVDALETFDKLVDLGLDDPDGKFLAQNKLIEARLNQPSPIAFSGHLNYQCKTCDSPSLHRWSHTLYRDSFSIDQIKGSIEGFELYCGYHWAKISFQSDMIWNVKSKWGKCDIYVEGVKDTTFKLIEMWNSPPNQ